MKITGVNASSVPSYIMKGHIFHVCRLMKTINKVKNDRKFAHETLCGGRPHAQKPAFCPVCDRDSESSSDCKFYRVDSRRAMEGSLPADYANVRRLLVARRYLVLDERGETHKYKF